MTTKLTFWTAGLLLTGLTNGLSQPVIITQPQDQTVIQGATVTFSVQATGEGPLAFQWRDYTNPFTFTMIPGATQASLVLTNAQPTFHRFAVEVSNSETSVVSRLARLNVLPPPTITSQPTNQTGMLGQTVVMAVDVSGAEPFSFQWRYQGDNLIDETNRNLSLPNLNFEHAGSYDVVVTNISGSVTSQVAKLSLSVTINPPFDPGLSIDWDQDQMVVSWTGEGELQSAESPTGPWRMIPTANSTSTFRPADPRAFFRIQNPNPRPVNVFVPSSYDPQTSWPLILLLHGYNASPAWIENYMHLEPLAESRGFLYCKPEGTKEPDGDRFWNATDSCCNFIDSDVDDVAYLTSLIEEIIRVLGADPKRIHLAGHSNGGFMSYRMACERASMITSIASLAGATWLDPNACQPSQPVNILQIHGTADDLIFYDGGLNPFGGVAFPGAMATIQTWAGYNGCTALETEVALSMDLHQGLPGLDSSVTRYTNCPPGGAVELWSIVGGNHVPHLSTNFSPQMVDWLLSHSKPLAR